MGILKTALMSIFGTLALLLGAGAPAHAAGLPQLEISTFPPQLIWLVITFVSLYLMMSRIALPRIAQILEERQHKISDNLKKAETLREEAQAAAEAYQAALSEARAKAHAIMLETHNRIANDAAKAQADVSAELEAKIKAAEAAIGEAVQSAMADLGAVAAEVAQSAAEKITGESLSKQDVAKVIDSVMEERR